MAIEYLDEKHFKGFDKYKYSCIDTSPLAKYVMHPFWNYLVEFYPMWIAPNLLTFVGFLFQLGSFLLLAYFDWDFYASNRLRTDHPQIPNWVWYLTAVCQFLGHTLDGTDGKQARRTHTSTPLGELFDHGLDSLIAALMTIGLFSVFSNGEEDFGGSTWIFIAILWIIVITFFISHWEKYLTGLLFLPWSYDFSQVSIAVVYFLTGFCGIEIWKQTLPYGIQFNYFFVSLVCAGSVLVSIPQSVYNIYRANADGTGKGRSLREAAEPLVPMFILFSVATAWAYFSPGDILETHLRTFLLMMSFIFSNITVRLIISQMTDTRATSYNFLLIPLVLAAAVSCLLPPAAQYEVQALYAVFWISLVLHLHYGVTVVAQLCDHFNIYAFSITSRPVQKNRPAPKARTVQKNRAK